MNVTVIMLCNYVFGELIKFGKDAYWLRVPLHHGVADVPAPSFRRDYAEGFRPSGLFVFLQESGGRHNVCEETVLAVETLLLKRCHGGAYAEQGQPCAECR